MARPVRTAAAVALTVLGLSQIAGVVLGLPRLALVGHRLVVAPLPAVFARRAGFETYARRFELTLHLADGTRLRLEGDRAFAARLRGPTGRVNGVLGVLTFWNLYPESARDRVLRFLLCEPGAIASELGADEPVRGFAIRTWSSRPGSEPPLRVALECVP